MDYKVTKEIKPIQIYNCAAKIIDHEKRIKSIYDNILSAAGTEMARTLYKKHFAELYNPIGSPKFGNYDLKRINYLEKSFNEKVRREKVKLINANIIWSYKKGNMKPTL